MQIFKNATLVILLVSLFLFGCNEEEKVKYVTKSAPKMTHEFSVTVPSIFSDADQKLRYMSFDLSGTNNNNNFYKADISLVTDDGICYVNSTKLKDERLFFSFYDIGDSCMENEFFYEDLEFKVTLYSLVEITWEINQSDLSPDYINYNDHNDNYISYNYQKLIEYDELYKSFTLFTPYHYGDDNNKLKNIKFLLTPNTSYEVEISNSWLYHSNGEIDEDDILGNLLDDLLGPDNDDNDNELFTVIITSDIDGIVSISPNINFNYALYVRIKDKSTGQYIKTLTVKDSTIYESSHGLHFNNPW